MGYINGRNLLLAAMIVMTAYGSLQVISMALDLSAKIALRMAL